MIEFFGIVRVTAPKPDGGYYHKIESRVLTPQDSDFFVTASFDNEYPRTLRVDNETGEIIRAALRHGRNEMRCRFQRLMEFEREG